MIILVIYMYGAMCLKYASGAESFVQAVSYTLYNDADEWGKRFFMDPYYRKILIKFIIFSWYYHFWSSVFNIFIWKY